MKINVYDFDKTIYDGDSTLNFYKFCLKRYPTIALRWPQLAFYGALFFIKAISKTAFKEKMYRFLQTVPDVDKAVSDFWIYEKSHIKDWYLEQKNELDIISSASPEFLLKPICSELGVRLIASVVNPRTGVYTGLNNYGKEKVSRLKEEYPDVIIQNFYSDSLSDTPLAEISENAYIVKGNIISAWPH